MMIMIIIASKLIGVEINTEKTMSMSSHRSSRSLELLKT